MITKAGMPVIFCVCLFVLPSPDEGISLMVTTMRTLKKTTGTLTNQAELRHNTGTITTVVEIVWSVLTGQIQER